MEQTIFFAIFNFFNATTFGSMVAIFLASWFPFVLVSFLFFYEWYVRRGKKMSGAMRASIILLIPATIALALSQLIKFIAPSPRPFLIFDITPLISVSEGMGSFPSTHATFFAALALTLYLQNHTLGRWYFASMILVALGRIAVGVHFPIDVFIGILLGLIVGVIASRVKNF